MTTPYEFAFEPSGRCGIIRCTKGNLEMKLDWEIAGRGKAEILLAPLDLRKWNSGITLPREEQRAILDHLRSWLSSEKIKADIDPMPDDSEPESCVMSGCHENRVQGSAFCPDHVDEALLRK